MLKQGVKTINAEFIQIRALSRLSFVQFRPYAISFPGLLFSLTLMPKSKRTLETSLDLTFWTSYAPLFQACCLVFPRNLLKDVLNRAGEVCVVLTFDICNIYEIVAYEWLYLQYCGG